MTLTKKQKQVIMFLLTIRPSLNRGESTYDPFAAYMAHTSTMMLNSYIKGTVASEDAEIIKICRELYLKWGRDFKFRDGTKPVREQTIRVSTSYLKQFIKLKSPYVKLSTINMTLHRGKEFKQFLDYIKQIEEK